MRKTWWTLLIAVPLWAACTLSPPTDDDQDAPPTAEEQCESFHAAYCERAITCYEALGVTAPREHQQNVTMCLEQSPNCTNAVDVAPSYSTCLAELPSASCQEFIDLLNGVPGAAPLPSSCKDVIDFED